MNDFWQRIWDERAWLTALAAVLVAAISFVGSNFPRILDWRKKRIEQSEITPDRVIRAFCEAPEHLRADAVKPFIGAEVRWRLKLHSLAVITLHVCDGGH